MVIPVYNSERTVEYSVMSVQKQSYSNLEIIIINDGSTDNSLNICNRLAMKDARIIIYTQENAGLSEARNSGISISQGQWITFVDSDDIIHPCMIEILLDQLKIHSADLAVCNVKKVKNQDVQIDNTSPSKTSLALSSAGAINKALINQIPLFAYGKIAKSNLFRELRFPSGRFYEDEVTSIQLFMKSSKIIYCTNDFYYYVQNTNGITKQPKEKHARDILTNTKEIETILTDRLGINKKALYAHLCSNYTLAYNIAFKSCGDEKLFKLLFDYNREAYDKTNLRNIRCQRNWVSIVLLRFQLYRLLLNIKRV